VGVTRTCVALSSVSPWLVVLGAVSTSMRRTRAGKGVGEDCILKFLRDGMEEAMRLGLRHFDLLDWLWVGGFLGGGGILLR
jgi:hypothetical protein